MSDRADYAEMLPEHVVPLRSGVGINVRRLIKLRGRSMALIFTAILVPCAVAVFLLVPREYVAEANIEFRATAQSMFSDQVQLASGTPAYISYVNTQLELIDGFTILSRVAADEEVKQLPSLRGLGDRLIAHLMDHLDIANEELTELATLSFRNIYREDAIAVLNAILREYEEYAREQDDSLRARGRAALAESIKGYEADLDRRRQEIADLRKSLEVPAGITPGMEPTETESFRINLAQAEADIADAQAAIRAAENQMQRTQSFIERNDSDPAAPVFAQNVEQEVNKDPNVLQLTQQLAQVQQDFSKLEETYVPEAPQLKVKRHELDGVESKLSEVKATARSAALRSLHAQHDYERTIAEANLQDAQARRDRFMALLEEYRQENLELSRGLADIEELERGYDDKRKTLVDANSRVHMLDLEAQAPARASIGSATSSSNPDSSERIKTLLFAAMGAFVVAAATGVLRELSDQAIRSAEDIGYVAPLPVIASIPHATEDRLPENVRMEMVTMQHPASFTADEIRRAVSRILHGGRGGAPAQVCMVASPARGDGKTTLACNVAIGLAQAGHRVLLVDVDSRNPGVEHQFGLQPGAGLAELLTGDGLEHDPSRDTGFDNLSILGPGASSQNLVELLTSRTMGDFIAGAREVFDHIIIDAPASLLMSEARLLAPLSDGILIVAGVGITTFGMLRRMLRAVEETGGRVIGVVVNGVKQAPGGYLRENLEAYYAQSPAVSVGSLPNNKVIRRRQSSSIVLVPDDEPRG